MTGDRSTERCQRFSRAPSAAAKRRNAPVHPQCNIIGKIGARAVLHPGAMQTSQRPAQKLEGSCREPKSNTPLGIRPSPVIREKLRLARKPLYTDHTNWPSASCARGRHGAAR